MSYKVLARKWRPQRFEDMIGQAPVLEALGNALDSGRLHHAYLFTGMRGVGKTTIARIFAKCLNCENNGISARPCGECTTCRDIEAGRFLDLIEVDAASRTKVDETRELLENVPYAPASGRFKVYLIDEVHMFSNHSFNALLKTLEEPPEHVKFLLATTDPQKVPVTVLSRCLQFNLRRLPTGRLADYLAGILEAEGIRAERAALELIARASEGSVRDSLSLVEQAAAFGDGKVEQQAVESMLGRVSLARLHDLLEKLAVSDAVALLAAIEALAEYGPDYAEVLGELMSILHRTALLQQVPGCIEADDPERTQLVRLAELLSPEAVQLHYQIGQHARRDMPFAPDPREAFDMALLRMLAFAPAGGSSGGPRYSGSSKPVSETTQKSAAVAMPSGDDTGKAPPLPAAGALPGTGDEPVGVDVSGTAGASGTAGTSDAAGASDAVVENRQDGADAVVEDSALDALDTLGAPPVASESVAPVVGVGSADEPAPPARLPVRGTVSSGGPLRAAALAAVRGEPLPTARGEPTVPMRRSTQAAATPSMPAAPSTETSAQVALRVIEQPPVQGSTDGTGDASTVAKGTVTEGTVTEGAVTEGAVTEGAVTKGTADEGTADESRVIASSESGPRRPLTNEQWPTIVTELDLVGMPRQLADHCCVAGVEGNRVTLLLDPGSDMLASERFQRRLADALAAWHGVPKMDLIIENADAPGRTPARIAAEKSSAALEAARRSIADDPVVTALISELDAVLDEASVQPLPQQAHPIRQPGRQASVHDPQPGAR